MSVLSYFSRALWNPFHFFQNSILFFPNSFFSILFSVSLCMYLHVSNRQCTAYHLTPRSRSETAWLCILWSVMSLPASQAAALTCLQCFELTYGWYHASASVNVKILEPNFRTMVGGSRERRPSYLCTYKHTKKHDSYSQHNFENTSFCSYTTIWTKLITGVGGKQDLKTNVKCKITILEHA